MGWGGHYRDGNGVERAGGACANQPLSPLSTRPLSLRGTRRLPPVACQYSRRVQLHRRVEAAHARGVAAHVERDCMCVLSRHGGGGRGRGKRSVRRGGAHVRVGQVTRGDADATLYSHVRALPACVALYSLPSRHSVCRSQLYSTPVVVIVKREWRGGVGGGGVVRGGCVANRGESRDSCAANAATRSPRVPPQKSHRQPMHGASAQCDARRLPPSWVTTPSLR